MYLEKESKRLETLRHVEDMCIEVYINEGMPSESYALATWYHNFMLPYNEDAGHEMIMRVYADGSYEFDKNSNGKYGYWTDETDYVYKAIMSELNSEVGAAVNASYYAKHIESTEDFLNKWYR